MVLVMAIKFYGKAVFILSVIDSQICIHRAELTTKAALHPAPAKAAPHNYYQPNFGAKGMRSAQVHISYLSKQVSPLA